MPGLHLLNLYYFLERLALLLPMCALAIFPVDRRGFAFAEGFPARNDFDSLLDAVAGRVRGKGESWWFGSVADPFPVAWPRRDALTEGSSIHHRVLPV